MTFHPTRRFLLVAIAAALQLVSGTAAAEIQGQTIRHVTIRGYVQHVHYRLWTREKALQIGVQGWVRNRRDGSVEGVFAGSRAAVNKLLAACRRGPDRAKVFSIDQRDGSPAMLEMRAWGDRFSILPTL